MMTKAVLTLKDEYLYMLKKEPETHIKSLLGSDILSNIDWGNIDWNSIAGIIIVETENFKQFKKDVSSYSGHMFVSIDEVRI